MSLSRLIGSCLMPCLLTCLTTGALAANRVEPVKFEKETLENGLRVIYAPLRQAPVVHVRVLYEVGSRDERPDRQGFAHMFEHMMFRGSRHVAAEEHMKLIGQVGGNSNAFTSFDQTTYVNTIPAEHTEMALWLEADRMASFKVNEEIYKTERNVVAKEWGIRQNNPYGTLNEIFLKNAFTKHSYRWTPIGDMDHLRAAPVNELQDFFNKYYVPNNACLIIAGDIDVEKTRAMVHKYFGWIPRGADVVRDIPEEPEQTELRRVVHPKRDVPLAVVQIGYKLPGYRSNDYDALSLLGSILGGGRSSRLDRQLVHGADPVALAIQAGPMRLVDAGMFSISARLIPGKKAEDVEAQLFAAVEKLVKEGVTPEELEKAKTAERIATIRSRETCTSIASMLGEEEVFGGDANRVNEELARIEALTVADLQAVAAKYLQPQRATVLHFVPDPTGSMARRQESDAGAAAEAAMKEAPVAVATGEVKPREVTFPEGYPTRPPMSEPASKAVFAKGEATEVNGVQVVVMPDSRIPMVNIAVVMRSGSHSDPPGKEGLASLTASMVRRGTSELPFEKLNEMLESRGIMLEVNEASDHSRVMAGCITDELDTTVDVMKQVVFGAPAFDPVEFEKLKKQTINQIRQSRANPQTAAQLDLQSELWGNSVLGRSPSMESVAAITLDDVKAFHAAHFVPTDALMVISGDVTTEKAQALATRLLEGWTGSAPPKVDYSIMPASSQRRIILIDNPDGKQSVIRMANRAYDNSSEERFAGSLASQILSAGIDSRLGKYVRAEKGYAYGVAGVFRPTRQAGAFEGSTETAFETTADAIRAMFKVFEDMKSAPVTPAELSEAKSRVAGNMVMEMQTIAQQAQRRIDVVLNKYPLDYYDNLPARIAQVTDAQIQDVMNRYVKPEETLIVVVAPAEKVQEQLQSLGKVEVRPMPLKRGTPSTQPSEELLKK